MLSILPLQGSLFKGLPYSLERGRRTETGALWLIRIGTETYKVDMPFHDGGLVHHRGSHYGICNVAQLQIPAVLAKLDPNLVAQFKAMGHSEAQIAWNEGPNPCDLDIACYKFRSGLEVVIEVLWTSMQAAFDPRIKLKRPDFIQDRLFGAIHQEMVFYRIPEEKPRDEAIAQRIVRFNDRPLVQDWLINRGLPLFVRHSSFYGKLDFLASQDEDASFKAYILEGVRIGNGRLEGHGTAGRIGLISRTPFGHSVDPVRLVSAQSNIREARQLVATERPIVGWSENPKEIELVDGDPFDRKIEPGWVPGANLTVALMTWPKVLYGDLMILSRAAAERSVYYVPVPWHFWTGPNYEFLQVAGNDDPKKPTQMTVSPGETIGFDTREDGAEQPIDVPKDLFRSGRIVPSSYRCVTMLAQDLTVPVIDFDLSPDQTESPERRCAPVQTEWHLAPVVFAQARGLDGNWQLLDKVTGAPLDPAQPVGQRPLQARAYSVSVRHSCIIQIAAAVTTGDKLTTRYGYKGVVRVIDEHLMPDGIDLLIGQEYVLGRGLNLPVMGEMAVGKLAVRRGRMARVGSDVSARDAVTACGRLAYPDDLAWPMIWRLVGNKRVRLLYDVAHHERSTQWFTVNEAEEEACYWDEDFDLDEQGCYAMSVEHAYVQAVTGPLYMLMMNRNPEQQQALCEEVGRDSAWLARRGDGSVTISVNEIAILRSLGLDDLADYLSWHDPYAASQARELAEVLLGGVFVPKEGETMLQLEQFEQAAGLDPNWLPEPKRQALSAMLQGAASLRRNRLRAAEPNSHWQHARLVNWQCRPEAAPREAALRNELARVLALDQIGQPDCPWTQLDETDDGAGGVQVTYRRRDETTGAEIVQATVLRTLKAIQARELTDIKAN